MEKKRKSFKTLAADLKALRKRPASRGLIDRFNKLMEEDERIDRADHEIQQRKKVLQKENEATD
ncbi:MAG: hypothetical protein HY537_08635 [Deltaproteobacteria bacterium]|nr:hypothetical protein [Deltaproteobacteria bacterium]